MGGDRIFDAVAPELLRRGIRLTGEVLGRGTYGIVYKGTTCVKVSSLIAHGAVR